MSSVPTVPLGFRFSPTDLELITFFLREKICNPQSSGLIEEMDIYSCEPWLLPLKANQYFTKNEWFYFVRRTRYSKKNKNGKRPNRKVAGQGNKGTWRSREAEKPIFDHHNKIVGYKQSLNFVVMVGGKRKGIKTDWLMKEFRMASDTFQEWVLCRIRYKTSQKSFSVDNPALDHQNILDHVPKQSSLIKHSSLGSLEEVVNSVPSKSVIRCATLGSYDPYLDNVAVGYPCQKTGDEVLMGWDDMDGHTLEEKVKLGDLGAPENAVGSMQSETMIQCPNAGFCNQVVGNVAAGFSGQNIGDDFLMGWDEEFGLTSEELNKLLCDC